jgi:hemerythrin-like metal-binding protein
MSMTMSAGAVRSPTGGRPNERAAGDARMPVYLKWIDAFETGNVEIDALHRELVEDCNSLLLLVENDAAWPLILADAKKLVEGCVQHFRAEESLLERTKFARSAEHKAEHRRLEHEMQRLIDRMEQVDGSLKEHGEIARSFGPSLIDVLIRHDLDFRSHLLHQQGR